MACFVVPMAEAVVVTAVKKVVKRKEKGTQKYEAAFSKKLGWLENLLWGGSALLAFEHMWHGEIIPWFPFFTAAQNERDMVKMLQEMSSLGVSMAAAVTLFWAGMLIYSKGSAGKTVQKTERIES